MKHFRLMLRAGSILCCLVAILVAPDAASIAAALACLFSETREASEVYARGGRPKGFRTIRPRSG